MTASDLKVSLQDLAWVALECGAVEVLDIAEHATGRFVGLCPRQQLECGGVGPGENVGLVNPAETVDRRTVELHTLVEHRLELGRRDRNRLELAEDVGEPQADEAHAALFDRAKDVFLFSRHEDSRWWHVACRNGERFPSVAGPSTQWKACGHPFTLRSQSSNNGENDGCEPVGRCGILPLDATCAERAPTTTDRGMHHGLPG